MKRPRNWNEFCPNPNCSDCGKKCQGNISSIATYETKSGTRRIFKCSTCGKGFSETRGTIFFDLRTEEDKVLLVIKLRLKRMTIADIAEVLEVTEETVLRWLERAYSKSKEINEYLLRNLKVTQVQLDELWTFVRRKISKDAKQGEVESPPESCDGRQWWWVGFDPESRLLLSVVVGPRCYQVALQLIQAISIIVCGIPVFFSDGLPFYKQALLAVYRRIINFPRTGHPGRPRGSEVVPHPQLAYGQVIKSHSKKNGLRIISRIIWGADKIKQLGLKISTSLIERLNLTLRQSLAPLARKSLAFAKKKANLQGLAYLFQAYYNLVRSHSSLSRLLRSEEQKQYGCISCKWKPVTPGMEAEITDHVWSFKELFVFKIPPNFCGTL